MGANEVRDNLKTPRLEGWFIALMVAATLMSFAILGVMVWAIVELVQWLTAK
jgi:hypothetical protein